MLASAIRHPLCCAAGRAWGREWGQATVRPTHSQNRAAAKTPVPWGPLKASDAAAPRTAPLPAFSIQTRSFSESSKRWPVTISKQRLDAESRPCCTESRPCCRRPQACPGRPSSPASVPHSAPVPLGLGCSPSGVTQPLTREESAPLLTRLRQISRVCRKRLVTMAPGLREGPQRPLCPQYGAASLASWVIETR